MTPTLLGSSVGHGSLPFWHVQVLEARSFPANVDKAREPHRSLLIPDPGSFLPWRILKYFPAALPTVSWVGATLLTKLHPCAFSVDLSRQSGLHPWGGLASALAHRPRQSPCGTLSLVYNCLGLVVTVFYSSEPLMFYFHLFKLRRSLHSLQLTKCPGQRHSARS